MHYCILVHPAILHTCTLISPRSRFSLLSLPIKSIKKKKKHLKLNSDGTNVQNCEVQELLLVYVSGIPIFCSLLGPKSSISRDPTQNKYKDLIECT